MVSEKQRPQNEAFVLSKKLAIMETVLIIVSYIYSIANSLYFDFQLDMIISSCFIICIFLISIWSENEFYSGHNKKIDFFLDNSFDINRIGSKDVTYYDNRDVQAGLKKVLANLHENCLYTTEISKVMRKFYTCIFLIIIFVFVFLIYQDRNRILLSTFLNFLLTGNVIKRTLCVKELNEKSNFLLEECLRVCSKFEENKFQFEILTVDIISIFIKYENTIVNTKVGLWSWIYRKKDRELREYWLHQKSQYEIYRQS